MTGQMVKLPEDEDTPEKVSQPSDCNTAVVQASPVLCIPAANARDVRHTLTTALTLRHCSPSHLRYREWTRSSA